MLVGFLLACITGLFQVDAEIAREESQLLALGIDIRPITADRDAKADYSAIVGKLKAWKGQPGKTDEVFAMLEAATQKPFAHFTRTQQADEPIDRLNVGVIRPLYSWCWDHAFYWANKRDFRSLERLYKFEKRFKEQLYAADSAIFGMWLPDASPPLGYLTGTNKDVRNWLKGKLQSFDVQGMLLARLSRFGRLARNADGVGMAPLRSLGQHEINPPPKPIPKWQKESETDPLFKKKADLVIVRQLRVLAEQTLRMPAKQAHARNFGRALWNLVAKQQGNPAAWASDHLDIYIFDYFDLGSWYEGLIWLDLWECRDAGKPLVPTWSKPYCIDVRTGAPIIVRATKSKVSMSSTSAGGSWNTSERW